jgi:hypothetical protein
MDHQAICSQIKKSTLGESSIFKDGMTVFQLFYLYSSIENFCLHSDWLLGYVLEFYVDALSDMSQPGDTNHQTLEAIEAYPSCGNLTETSGAIRPCTMNSKSCHNLGPRDLEFFSLHSFVKSPSDYDATPMLSSTDLDEALSIVEGSKVCFLMLFLLLFVPLEVFINRNRALTILLRISLF